MESKPKLREKKKRKTRREILANAIALFRKGGIRETRTSEIARLSGVSVGTLFNYFPTKDALVEAWLRGEVDAVLREAAENLGGRGLRPMLRQVCRTLVADCLEPRALRREGWQIAGRSRSDHFMLDESAPLVRVVRAEAQRDRVRNDLRPRALAQMLVDELEGGLIGAMTTGVDSNPPHDRRELEGRVELILDGMRKRNERVIAPRESASRAQQ